MQKRTLWMAILICAATRLPEGEAAEQHPTDGSPATSAIGFYQRNLSALRYVHCPFNPSCSEYAVETIRQRGLLTGSPLISDRLVRCNSSAHRYYARGADRRLLDPVEGTAPAPLVPRVPSWLIPSTDMEPPKEPAGVEPRALEDAAFAQALARDGDCERASTEFRRAAHSAGTPGMTVWAYMQSGTCFFALEHWNTATDEFLLAASNAPTPDLERSALQLAAASQFNGGHYMASESLLQESTQFSDDAQRSLLLLGLCDMAEGRWTSARGRFTEALEGPAGRAYPAKLRYLVSQTAAGEDLSHRSPSLATAFSAVFPGSGQMYCGRFQDGLRHLIFNGALIYSVVELARGKHYAAAYLVAGIELPFYLGNILGARRAASSFNRNARLSFVASSLVHTEP